MCFALCPISLQRDGPRTSQGVGPVRRECRMSWGFCVRDPPAWANQLYGSHTIVLWTLGWLFHSLCSIHASTSCYLPGTFLCCPAHVLLHFLFGISRWDVVSFNWRFGMWVGTSTVSRLWCTCVISFKELWNWWQLSKDEMEVCRVTGWAPVGRSCHRPSVW